MTQFPRFRPPLLIMLALGALAAGACTANPGSGTAVPASPSANIIEIGTIGELPPRVHATGPRLTYPPPSSLRIAQSFPLGSIVKFQIPLRNDGDAPLIIDKVEPT